MRIALFPLGLLFTIACGAASAGPNAPSDAPSSAATSAPDSAPSAASDCLAVGLKAKPSAATESAGELRVQMGEEECVVEVKGKDGKTTTQKEPCGKGHGPDMREALRQAVCRLGGDAFWPTGAPPTATTKVLEISVGRYASPNEGADLKLICSPFSALRTPAGKAVDEASLDDSQRARIRAQILEETMTSKKWRLWLHDFLKDRDKAVTTLREAAKGAAMKCDIEWTKGTP